MKVSLDLSTEEFLRALQLHTFEYGVPVLVLSDLGSQLVAGAAVVTDFLNDPSVLSYFEKNMRNIPPFSSTIRAATSWDH